MGVERDGLVLPPHEAKYKRGCTTESEVSGIIGGGGDSRAGGGRLRARSRHNAYR